MDEVRVNVLRVHRYTFISTVITCIRSPDQIYCTRKKHDKKQLNLKYSVSYCAEGLLANPYAYSDSRTSTKRPHASKLPAVLRHVPLRSRVVAHIGEAVTFACAFRLPDVPGVPLEPLLVCTFTLLK